MRYHWDQRTLFTARNKLMKMMNNTDDINLKIRYQKSLDALNSAFFEALSNARRNGNYTYNNLLYNMTSDFTSYGRYYSLIEKIYKELSCFNKEINNINDYIDSIENKTKYRVLTTPRFTHDKTYSLVHDFYKYLDKELYQLFLKQYNNRYKNTRFNNPLCNNLEGSTGLCSGDCYYVYGLDINYISVIDNMGILKYTDLVHENGHAIANFMNPEAVVCESENFIGEVESLFPELLSTYLDNGEFTDIERKYMQFNVLDVYLDMVKTLTKHKLIVDLWQKYDFKDTKEFYKDLRNYGITKEDLKAICCSSMGYEGIYIFSYFIALKLLHIYKKKPKEALKIYKKIIKKYRNTDSLFIIDKELNILENAKEDANEIIDNVSLSLGRAN